MTIVAIPAVDMATHRVLEFFCEENSEECKETNIYHVDVAKRAFKLAGLKRGTIRRANETASQYRARRAYSDIVSQALRYLNLRHGHIEHLTLTHVLMFHSEDINAALGRRISLAHQLYECGKAAQFALDNWDAEAYRKIQEGARAAGRKGKKYTLDDFHETRGMTPTEASRHLGVSRPTIYAMRREYSNVNPTTGELHGDG